MNKCKKYRDMITADLYGDLSINEARLLKKHLESCKRCAGEYRKTAAALEMMNMKKRPDPGKEYWDSYWDRLHRRIKSEGITPSEPARRRNVLQDLFLPVPKWAFQTAAALLLVGAGIFIGSRYFGGKTAGISGNQTALQGAPDSRTQLVRRAEDYIERSKILILAMVNFETEEDPYALNLPYQKQVSGRLVEEAAVLKDGLTDPAHKKMRQLITDLELILLQIANLESENDLAAVEFVKSGVNQTGILLRINTLEIAGAADKPDIKSESRGGKKI